MNKDRLTTGANAVRVRDAAYRAITKTQDDPAVQVLGMAVALYATCEALNVDIKQLLVSCERMKNDLDGPFIGTFRAIRDYAQGELR